MQGIQAVSLLVPWLVTCRYRLEFRCWSLFHRLLRAFKSGVQDVCWFNLQQSELHASDSGFVQSSVDLLTNKRLHKHNIVASSLELSARLVER